jgi:hypothetical protein
MIVTEIATEAEQNRLEEIKARVFEASLTFQAHTTKSKGEYLSAVREFLIVLTDADANLTNLSADLDNEAEQIEDKRHGKVIHPKRDDPFFRLNALAVVPYIHEVRKKKEELEALLASQAN